MDARSKKYWGNAGVSNSTPMLKLNKTAVENLTLLKWETENKLFVKQRGRRVIHIPHFQGRYWNKIPSSQEINIQKQTFKFVSKADAILAVKRHRLNRPSPSFRTQLRAAADASERLCPTPIARNIAYQQQFSLIIWTECLSLKQELDMYNIRNFKLTNIVQINNSTHTSPNNSSFCHPNELKASSFNVVSHKEKYEVLFQYWECYLILKPTIRNK